jgi:hypothetical protein
MLFFICFCCHALDTQINFDLKTAALEIWPVSLEGELVHSNLIHNKEKVLQSRCMHKSRYEEYAVIGVPNARIYYNFVYVHLGTRKPRGADFRFGLTRILTPWEHQSLEYRIGINYYTCSWLRHYATSRKVAGLIPDVIGFVNWPNPSSRTMALGSTQPLTEMVTRNLPGGKGRPARGADFTAICEERASTSHNPMGLHSPLQG